MGTIPDGSGADGPVEGSGSLITSEVRKELLKHGLEVRTSTRQDQEGLLAEAKTLAVPYVLVGGIPKWEDNATGWSGKRDYSSIALELYRVGDGVLVASSNRNVQGVTVPEYWADWLAWTAVADILGKPAPKW